MLRGSYYPHFLSPKFCVFRKNVNGNMKVYSLLLKYTKHYKKKLNVTVLLQFLVSSNSEIGALRTISSDSEIGTLRTIFQYIKVIYIRAAKWIIRINSKCKVLLTLQYLKLLHYETSFIIFIMNSNETFDIVPTYNTPHKKSWKNVAS